MNNIFSPVSRRFTGSETLYGTSSFANIARAHYYVIGTGGVGSWAVEALARTGVGNICLIDMDIVSESNINRQLPALDSTLGDSKIAVMKARVCDINPACNVTLVDDFLTPDNVAKLLPTRDKCQALQANGTRVIVLDCVDDIRAKTAIALHCRFHKIKLLSAGGAGGKLDPSQLSVADLKDVYQDPLLAKLRYNLRKMGINRDLEDKFFIKCVYSSEPPKTAKNCQSRLACGGYGSAMTVTCTMAMLMVAESLKWLHVR